VVKVNNIITNTGTNKSINGETFANFFIMIRFDRTNRIIKKSLLKSFRPSYIYSRSTLNMAILKDFRYFEAFVEEY